MANRLKTYHEQTEPVVNYYQDNSSVCTFDANIKADEVTALMFEKLDSLVSV